MADLEIDDERQRVLDLLEEGKNVSISGKGGAGKSALSNYWLGRTKKKVLRLASTGIAAVNIGGQTWHSAFHFTPGTTIGQVKRVDAPWTKIFSNIDAVLGDEMSMNRADLIDLADKFLRLHGKDERLPFGGIQLIGVSDLCQLPPVVTSQEEEFFKRQYGGPYYFDAHCFPSLEMHVMELQRVFRQKDPEFVRVLNLIRMGEATAKDLRLLNSRVDLGFELGKYPNHVYLATRNRIVDAKNATKLSELGSEAKVMQALISGRFPKDKPADDFLILKERARVMFLNNDSDKRWVNGEIGYVVGFGISHVKVAKKDGTIVEVAMHVWESVEQVYNKEKDEIERVVIGSYMQYPLRLAWAMTIHKSQGQTFPELAVDFTGGTFAHGQAYVGLSRATSLEGMVLPKKVTPKDIIFDPRIGEFLRSGRVS